MYCFNTSVIPYIHHYRSDSTTTPTAYSDDASYYLVFQSALLLLFTVCRFCSSRTSDVKKIVVGSFIRVTQNCPNCHNKWVWDSQLFIGNVPAGNLLTSAAILYAGALPTKALRVFKILNCATITAKTFFRHQRRFLQPAIISTWERHQFSLLEGMKSQMKKLSLSGDGRADSPGHSAKYGSYTVIEMSYNKVVDYKLVQVKIMYKRCNMHTYCEIVNRF